MIEINDLNIKQDIIPLFDYTLNPNAKDFLVKIFESLPPNVEEVHMRQNILKAMMEHHNIFKNYTYNKMDFLEVSRFINEIISGKTVYKIQAIGKYVFCNKIDRIRLMVGIVQFVQLFSRLQNRYFSHIDINIFPISFRQIPENIVTLLSICNLKMYEDKIIENTLDLRDISVIYHQMRAQISPRNLERFWHDLATFEAYLSLSKGILHNRFCFPLFHTAAHLKIKDFFHPLLKTPVLNSIDTDNQNVLLITGPNMSGKSTLLKSISICIYLGHLGLAIPAQYCEIPFYTSLSITINHKDDLQSGYSHFMSELQSLKNVVSIAAQNKSCFAVFDEIFKGTNTEDAVIISEKTINGLTKFPHSLFIITTHLHALKYSIKPEVGIYHLHCSLTDGRPAFTYQLQSGWSDIKIGQILFAQEGLSDLLS